MELVKSGLRVGDIMTREVISIGPGTSLLECSNLIIKKRIGGLVVCEEGKLIGIITKKDILWALVKKSASDLKHITVQDIMTRKVSRIKPSADITEAVLKFKKKKIKRLPVVEKGKIIGMITTRDIMRMEPGLVQLIVESTKIREEADKLKRSEDSGSKRAGVCERCGEYDVLIHVGLQHICENCYEQTN